MGLADRARFSDVLLPCSSVMAIVLYVRPDLLPTWRFDADPVATIVTLAAWGAIGGLGGVLATSTAFLAFCLLYSPIYLLSQLPRLIGPPGWVDRTEVRFYTRCFLLLCVVGVAAYLNPSAGVVTLIVLGGAAPVFWRFLV